VRKMDVGTLVCHGATLSSPPTGRCQNPIETSKVVLLRSSVACSSLRFLPSSGFRPLPLLCILLISCSGPKVPPLAGIYRGREACRVCDPCSGTGTGQSFSVVEQNVLVIPDRDSPVAIPTQLVCICWHL
jgi:hypothetical protein